MSLKLRGLTFSFAIILAVFGFLFFVSGASAVNVNQTGTYVSDVKNTGVATWGQMTWSFTNAAGSTAIKVRTCNISDCSDGTPWASCTTSYALGDTPVADISGNDCVTDGDSYIQYQVAFNENYDDTVSGSLITLDSVVINYTQYTSGASTLTSSKYSASTGNVMGGIQWTENAALPTGTQVGLYLRTAATEVGLTGDFNIIATSTPSVDWGTITGCSKTTGVVTCDATAIPSAMKVGGDDDFYQYMVILDSTGANTPTVSQVKVTYVVNAAPTFNTNYGSAGTGLAATSTDGLIYFSFSLLDEDTTTGNYSGYVTSTVYYTINNGSSWVPITSGLSGGFTTATQHIVNQSTHTNTVEYNWNPKQSGLDDSYYASSLFKFKVEVYDGELANNSASAISSGMVLDTNPPTTGSPALIIKATSTPVSITVSGSDDAGAPSYMRLAANNATLNGVSWEAYSTAKNDLSVSAGDTVYLQVKDGYTNTSTIDSLEPIPAVTSLMVQDTSNTAVSEYREFLAWREAAVDEVGAGFQEYRVMRSTDSGSTYSILTTIGTRTTNYYTDEAVSNGSTYYYKVAVVDTNGSVSYFSSAVCGTANGTQDCNEGGGGTSADKPTINEDPDLPADTGSGTFDAININSTSATITWETSDTFGSDSLVQYTKTPGAFSTASSTGISTQKNSTAQGLGPHSVTLYELDPGTVYYVQIRSTNTAVDPPVSDWYKYDVNGFYFITAAGPAIDSAPTVTATTTGALVEWTTTNKSSDSYVYYSENSSMTNSLRLGSSSQTTSHSVQIPDLDLNTTYYYYVVSTDNEANSDTYDNGGSPYPSFTTANDTTKPVITVSPSVTSTTNSATIVWTTDELSYSQVFYATDAVYTPGIYSDQTTKTSVLTRNHAVALSSLVPGTTYHYKVRSEDGSTNANYATSTDATFSLTGNPPVISSVATSSVTTSGATVTWTTDKASDSVVEYITSSGGDYTNAPSQGKAESTTSHSVTLTGLTAGTTYYFRVKSTDSDGNTGTGAGSNFTTNSGPTITFTKATDETVTQTTATITWTTDLSADSKVIYSTSDTLSNPITVASTTLDTTHQIIVNGLTLNSTYYYYLQSTDSEGNTATDNNSGTYYPLSTSADTTPPTIDDYSVITSTSTATITWTTNELSTSQVIYDTTSNYSTDASLDSGPAEDTTYTIEHSVVLTGLTHSTEYSFSMISNDISSNPVQSSVLTFTTIPATTASCPACPPCRSGGGSVTACSRPDKTAPIISGMRVSNIVSDGAKVIWKTNEMASALVRFGRDYNLESAYEGIRGDNSSFNTDHVVKLVNLLPNMEYFYQAIATDKSSNVAKSEVFKFKTESTSQDLIDKAKEGLDDILDIEKQIDEQGVEEANSLLQLGITKINDIINKFSNVLSVDVLENSVKDSLANIEALIPAPVIQGSPEVIVDQNKVTVNWRTNKEANSMILFVPEGDYDPTLSNPYIYQTGNSGLLTTSHSITIPNLLADTTYQYQIVSKSQVGPEATLSNLSFATAQEIPEVTYAQIEEITDFSATIVWATNLPTDSLVKYVPFDETESIYVEERSQVQGKAELVKNHLVTIANLDPGTTYELTLQGKDENGTAYEYDMGELNTSRDIRAPLITGIKTESSVFPNQKDRIQSVVTWNTDEESTTQIAYLESGSEDLTEENILAALEEQKNFIGEGDFQPGTSSIKMTKLDPELTNTHITVITKFKPATVYKFRAISVDPSGNISISPTFVTLTPQQKETVLEMIIKTFEDRFSWMKQLQ